MNKSTQRDVIYEVLKNTTSHPTADWVYDMAKEQIPNISKGTVYRNLNQLVENGMAIKVPGIFESDRFDANTDRHYHLICVKCGAVVDFDDNKSKIRVKLGENNGSFVQNYSLVYYGLCPKCNNKRSKTKKTINTKTK